MNAYDAVCTSLRARPKRWLVTGVAGFIGSALLEALLELDQEVTGLDDREVHTPGMGDPGNSHR